MHRRAAIATAALRMRKMPVSLGQRNPCAQRQDGPSGLRTWWPAFFGQGANISESMIQATCSTWFMPNAGMRCAWRCPLSGSGFPRVHTSSRSPPLPVFDPLLNTLRKLATLPNVTVRPSALDFGDAAPMIAGLHAGSTAAMADGSRASQCPAPQQGGNCGDCRTCWDLKETAVSYSKH